MDLSLRPLSRIACACGLVALPAAVMPPEPAAPAPSVAAAARQDREAEVAASYKKLADAQDEAALAAVWREHPDLVLVTIDQDLEGSLALREQSAKPDEAALAAMHARALFGARAAVAAGLHPILADYAASFSGWNAEQQKQFRSGQQAFGKARAAAKAGKHEEALAAANECAALAEPLGDWWGTAMGFSAAGQALAALGRNEEALVALGRARTLHHDLGLSGSEYGNLKDMVKVTQSLGRASRVAELARQGAALGRALGDEQGAAELEKLARSK
jgi:tetratricopeptide (TPR) repeat protein